MKTIEQQIKDLQETVKLLYSVVIEGKPYKPPDADEYFNIVIPALARGDVKPLISFNERHGAIPDYEPLPKESRRTYTYQPRKRAAHSLLPPEAEANPATEAAGILSGAKRGTLERHRRTSRSEPSGNAYANAQRMGASGTDCTGSSGDGLLSNRKARQHGETAPVILPEKERGAAFGQPKPNQVGYASP